MRRRINIWPVIGVIVAGCMATVIGGGMASGASTATTTVSVTVASATSLNAAGCASGTANVTDFGTVLPATSNVTSADCSVVFGSSNDTSMLRAYQTDVTGAAMFGMSTGSLDTTFDTDGKQTSAILAAADQGSSVAVQADGKIVVAGWANNGGSFDFAVARYTTAGALDATFDGDGKQTTSLGAFNDFAYAVAIQPDGKIVLAGTTWGAATSDAALVRYNTNGSLDTGFDGDGIAITDVAAGNDYAEGVAIQPDGKVVAGGSANTGANQDFAVMRYNANGSLDTSFDTDGKQTTPVLAASEYGKAVAVQSDGKIVVVGSASNGVDDDFAAVRYNANGSLDTGFDTDGKLTTTNGTAGDAAYGVVVQPDGRVVLGGMSYNGANYDFSVVRLNADGSLDTTFDGDGKQRTDVGSATADSGNSIALQPDGRLVLGGTASNDFAVVRYTSAGALDTTFDGDGKVITPVGAGSDTGKGVAIQADGKVVLAGYAAMANDDFAVVRYGGGGSVADWAGSWGAAGLFGACLHTVANASNTWTLAGAGNCTTSIDANWNALPTTASKIAFAGSGVTNATANLRYGFKATASQQAGTYVAPLTFEVVAPNA